MQMVGGVKQSTRNDATANSSRLPYFVDKPNVGYMTKFVTLIRYHDE